MIKNNAYYDSVTLMQVSRAVEESEFVKKAMISMGTDMNKELLKAAGLLDKLFEAAKPSDLIIAFEADEHADIEQIYQIIEDKLNEKAKDDKEEEMPPTSLSSAVKRYPELNLAVISVAGVYAAAEVRKALNKNLNVMLFSDNVSLEDEIALKKLAHEKGLLMMGPDCGTAIINSVGLCFANKIRKGDIGVVGASGTGTQEVTVLIDKMGGGVTQVIGTGGRDLSIEVGGIMMYDTLEALDRDEKTDVIVLISKPPVEEVAQRIIKRAEESKKNIVICFIGKDNNESAGNIHYVPTLEEAARKAVQLSSSSTYKELVDAYDSDALMENVRPLLQESQKYVRGLYCGGTVCDESAGMFDKAIPGKVFSNVGKVRRLEDAGRSTMHSFIDLGDDEFTVGRPHPMIEPSLRNSRIIQEAMDEETAIILFDVELGYGSHRDPAGEAVAAVREAKKLLASENRNVIFVAYVLGTEDDLQGYHRQMELLRSEGIILASSNARAAELCLKLIGGMSNE
ncbi:acyl-CoA synthetase FdrA [Proteiniclasticum aestuarii]|nr:acyl-CoA synthetase FdrA [Proteiniclasticum aestuarii]